MLNKKEKQHYTKEDIEFFESLSIFKKNYDNLKFDVIQNSIKVEEKYTINDYNNFDHIIKNHDTEITDHILNYNLKKQKDSEYSKNDIKNFEKIDNKFLGYEVINENFKDKTEFTKISQTNYKKNDLENFNHIIKNEVIDKKNSVKIVNVYDRKNLKLKKANRNLKKSKILYFD